MDAWTRDGHSVTDAATPVRTGKLSEESLVWRIGMHDWTAVDDVPQLRLVAGSRPPPAFVASDSPPPPDAQPVTSISEASSESTASTMPSSLAPITAEATAADTTRVPSEWGDVEAILASEQRADQQGADELESPADQERRRRRLNLIVSHR